MGTGIAANGTECIPLPETNPSMRCCGCAVQPYALVATGNFEVATCSPFGEPPPPTPPPSAVPAAANPAAANPAPSASPTASRPLPGSPPASSFTGAPTASCAPRLQPHLRQDRATSARRYGCTGRRQIVGVLSGSFTDGAAAGAQYAAARARTHGRRASARQRAQVRAERVLPVAGRPAVQRLHARDLVQPVRPRDGVRLRQGAAALSAGRPPSPRSPMYPAARAPEAERERRRSDRRRDQIASAARHGTGAGRRRRSQ